MENALADYQIVTIVHPTSNDPNTSGRVINLHCGGGVCHPHVMRTRGGYELNPGFARRGYRLLRDVYLEAGDKDGWERYARYVKAWQSKETRSPFPKQWLPQSVQDAQRCLIPDEFADAFKTAATTGDAKGAPKADAEVKPNNKAKAVQS